MGLAQLSTQRVDSFLCFEHLAKTPQVAQVRCTNAAPVLGFQWSGERGDNLFAVNGIGESEHLLARTSLAVAGTRRT
jgi:hypothetical protein